MTIPSTMLFRPVDAAAPALFRIGFGALVAWQAFFNFYPHVGDRFGPGRFHFTYPLFEWVKPWPGSGMYIECVVLGIAALALMLGIRARLAALVVCVAHTHIFLIDQAEFNNHYYLISLLAFLFFVSDSGAAYSIDQAFGLRPSETWIPFWHVVLFRAQLVIVYVFSGIAKLNGDWLRGQPLLHWLPREADHVAIIGPLLKEPWTAYFMSYAGLGLDLSVGFLLLYRRTRIVAFVLLIAFHGLNALLFKIGVFPWMALAASIVFIEPDAPRRWGARLLRLPMPTLSLAEWTPLPAYRVAVYAFLFAYLAVQIALPLRHFVYPGNASWTEEGHNFAWRMKLTHKRATAYFEVIDPASGERMVLEEREQLVDLTPRQRMQILARPQMILAYAHFLRDKLRAQGIAEPVIHAYVNVSLNGRPMQPLIDPQADLTKASFPWFRRAEWIVPLPPDLPIGEYGTDANVGAS